MERSVVLSDDDPCPQCPWLRAFLYPQGDIVAEWYRDESGKSVYGTRVRCRQCGKTFTAGYALARYCGYRCRNDAYIARRKEWRADARNLTCEHCGKAFIGKRNDAKFCTAACRQASYRKRDG